MSYYGGDKAYRVLDNCSCIVLSTPFHGLVLTPLTYIPVGESTEFVFQNDMAALAHPCARGIRASMHIISQLLANAANTEPCVFVGRGHY